MDKNPSQDLRKKKRSINKVQELNIVDDASLATQGQQEGKSHFGALSPNNQNQGPIEIDFAKNVGPAPTDLQVEFYNSYNDREQEEKKIPGSNGGNKFVVIEEPDVMAIRQSNVPFDGAMPTQPIIKFGGREGQMVNYLDDIEEVRGKQKEQAAIESTKPELAHINKGQKPPSKIQQKKVIQRVSTPEVEKQDEEQTPWHTVTHEGAEGRAKSQVQIKDIPVVDTASAKRLQRAAKRLGGLVVISQMRGACGRKNWKLKEREDIKVREQKKKQRKKRSLVLALKEDDEALSSNEDCSIHSDAEYDATGQVKKEDADMTQSTKALIKKQKIKASRWSQVPGFIDIEDPYEISDGAAYRFRQYQSQFMNMTQRTFCDTRQDIVTVLISYDSKLAFVVSNENDQLYFVRSYELDTDLEQHKLLIKISGKYIKAKDVKQNDSGHLFNLPYLDSGDFKILIFDKRKEIETVDVSKLLNLRNSTMAKSMGFADPMITTSFFSLNSDNENDIFVSLFLRDAVAHYHFVYSTKDRKIKAPPVRVRMDCSYLNYPYDCFFDLLTLQVHCFYRLGQSISVDCNDTTKFQYQELDCSDLAQMYFVYSKVLVARSSNQVLFFKQTEEIEDDLIVKRWQIYHSLNERGFIYFIRGNKQVQITTDKLIFFYHIDPNTLEPKLENCMYNFMGCSQMMYGPRSRYCITFKVGQVGFNLYKRKYNHNFVVRANSQDFEGRDGISVNSRKEYMIYDVGKLLVFDQQDFNQIKEIIVPFDPVMMEKDKAVKLKILHIETSECESYLAVIVGHVLVNEETRSQFLFVYQCKRNDFVLTHQRKLRFDLRDTSKRFQFNRNNVHEILLTSSRKIVSYNYEIDRVRELHVFQNFLNAQPIFAEFNERQKVAIISTFLDVLFVDIALDKEIDIDNDYQIGDIRSIVHVREKKKFYVLANKCQKLLGYFLLEIDDKPPVPESPTYLINWKSRLDMGDANLYLLENEESKTQSLVVSYKSIYINTYNVMVICLNKKTVIFRYEVYHLWEASIRGILLKNYDFVMISKDGTRVMSLGYEDKRQIRGAHRIDSMLHSLDSCNDLKLEESNHLMFVQKENELVISVQEQYEDSQSDTMFEDIYRVNVVRMSLRELLLAQSVFSCRRQFDIVNLIQLQPEPSLFYKSYLELEKSNLLQILSFDSRSIKALLDEKHSHLFSSEYPIFYRTKHHSTKDTAESAIDTAIENNQIRAVKLIIDYIIKHQNSYAYSHLFDNNLVRIIQKGIEISGLINSDVFCHRFDFQEWPAMHTNDNYVIKPYNLSMFKVRGNYQKVFPDIEQNVNFSNQREGINDLAQSFLHQVVGDDTKERIFKIKYTLNILPSINMDEEEDTLISSLCDTEDLEMFECKALDDLLQYKWIMYAFKLHLFGLITHLAYVLVFSYYVLSSFVYRVHDHDRTLAAIMIACLLYPLAYDMTQLKKQGLTLYFSDFWNFFDQFHIWFGFGNVYTQYYRHLEPDGDSESKLQNDSKLLLQGFMPQSMNDKFSKVFMMFVAFLILIKTFFYMRVFKNMSQMVSMMTQVIADLRVFLIFYLILVWMCSLVFNIIELGTNEKAKKENDSYIEQNKSNNKAKKKAYPGMEYERLPLFMGQVFDVIRISLGDFEFDKSTKLGQFENILYWQTWCFVILMTCIVFLNFIIAEVSGSYLKVKSRLNGMYLQERAQLIKESEDMIPKRLKSDKQYFPKYLITREVEE